MDCKKKITLKRKIFILIVLILIFLFFFASKVGGKTQKNVCGRHSGSSVCFCDCFGKIDLQLKQKTINKEKENLFFQQKVWTQSTNSFDTKKTFGKSTTTKQCSASGLYETGFDGSYFDQ